MDKREFFIKIKYGLIVSCYANTDYNILFSEPQPMLALARSVAEGGAVCIRVNLAHVAMLKKALDIPIYGIEKVYRGNEMRITPTLKEAHALVEAGADAIAIDATCRERFDNLSICDYIKELKKQFDIPVLGDISNYNEAVHAQDCGIDAVSTTLSGYTLQSSQFGKLGDIPVPEPDYELVERLSKDLSIPVIAEGRFNTPEKAARAIECGAHAVVVGTAISNPQKITELFCHIMDKTLRGRTIT